MPSGLQFEALAPAGRAIAFMAAVFVDPSVAESTSIWTPFERPVPAAPCSHESDEPDASNSRPS